MEKLHFNPYLILKAGNCKLRELSGDSGSPIIQKGKVVEILASVFYTNVNGIALSLISLKIRINLSFKIFFSNK